MRLRGKGVLATLPIAIAIGLACAPNALPQEPAAGESKQEAQDPLLWWKWANFAILTAGLGYLIAKNAPALFAQRSREIQQGMLEAAKQKQDAEAQAAVIEKRLAGLQGEIESLRSAAKAEIGAEGERIGRETERRLQRIQGQAGQELALMARAARFELRKYSAELAVDLAEQRIRSRITKDMQDGLVDGFLQDLRYRVTPGART